MSYLSPIGNNPIYGLSNTNPVNGISNENNDLKGQNVKGPGKECQTCKERKYVDGSNEMVSFKSPAHISPEQSATAVRAHEQEHVNNAYSKAANGNGQVIRASVALHTATCPECGRSYVAGGTTTTKIKYPNEDNPYQQDRKAAHGIEFKGTYADYKV